MEKAVFAPLDFGRSGNTAHGLPGKISRGVYIRRYNGGQGITLPVRVVNCFRDIRLVSSYTIKLPPLKGKEPPDGDFIKAAKAMLVESSKASEPFFDLTFVVRVVEERLDGSAER